MVIFSTILNLFDNSVIQLLFYTIHQWPIIQRIFVWYYSLICIMSNKCHTNFVHKRLTIKKWKVNLVNSYLYRHLSWISVVIIFYISSMTNNLNYFLKLNLQLIYLINKKIYICLIKMLVFSLVFSGIQFFIATFFVQIWH